MRDSQKKKPNKAPEPTTMAVTIRAPSSTARASHGRGSSLTLAENIVSKSLVRVLSYDVAILAAIVLYFWLDTKRLGFIGMLLPLGLVWLSIAGSKLQKMHVAALTRREKKIRFGVSSAGFIVLLGFVVSWAFRSGSGLAWALASLAIIVLAALYYAEWDGLNDELKQMPQNEAHEEEG